MAGKKSSKTWGDVVGGLMEGLREAYLAELERFAEDLGPQFASGGLGEWKGDDVSPTSRLQALVEERFGLAVTESASMRVAGDWPGAHALLAVSWWAEAMKDEQDGWPHPACVARIAVTQDLLDVAARRGLITRDPPYEWPPEAGAPRWLGENGSAA